MILSIGAENAKKPSIRAFQRFRAYFFHGGGNDDPLHAAVEVRLKLPLGQENSLICGGIGRGVGCRLTEGCAK